LTRRQFYSVFLKTSISTVIFSFCGWQNGFSPARSELVGPVKSRKLAKNNLSEEKTELNLKKQKVD